MHIFISFSYYFILLYTFIYIFFIYNILVNLYSYSWKSLIVFVPKYTFIINHIRDILAERDVALFLLFFRHTQTRSVPLQFLKLTCSAHTCTCTQSLLFSMRTHTHIRFANGSSSAWMSRCTGEPRGMERERERR